MSRNFAPAFAAAALMACAGPSLATLTYLHAEIADTNESPPTTPTVAATGTPRLSFGHADFWLDDSGPTMTMSVTFTGVDLGGQSPDTNDNLLAAHIHANATVLPGQNTGVVWGFFGSPLNDTAPNDIVITPSPTGVGGTITGKWDAAEGNATTLTAQMANILAGHSYINFHTTQYGSGEMRGFLQLPEPASLSLLSLPAIALLRRRPR